MGFWGINKKSWLQVIAAWIGWLMDGYTTIAYAFLAVTIAPLFFPSTARLISLIVLYGGFAAEALARPIGSIVLGNFLGDRMGRKAMLTTTILGFSIFAGLKGLLPTYDQIGIAAPIFLYIVLFIEGMFAGAEYGGGTALSMESIPPEKRGPIGAFVQSGFGTGYFIIAFVNAGLYSYLGPSNFSAYGWRIVFLTTFIPGIITLIIRIIAEETKVFKEMKERNEIAKIPVINLIRGGGWGLLFALLITSGLLFINTATFSFYPALFLEIRKEISITTMDLYVGIINLISLFGVWLGGVFALFLVERKKTLLLYSSIFVAITYPVAYFAFNYDPLITFIMFSIQAFFEAMIFSVLPAFLSETFSKKFRTTGVGFAYNGGAIFGGFAITIILATIYLFRLTLFSSWVLWLFIAEIIMILGIIFSKETYRKGEEDKIEL